MTIQGSFEELPMDNNIISGAETPALQDGQNADLKFCNVRGDKMVDDFDTDDDSDEQID